MPVYPLNAESPYADALVRRSIEGITLPWLDWLDHEGVGGYVGEVGWPNDLQRSMGDVARWNALADAWLDVADARNLWVSYFSVDEAQVFGGYSLNIYTSVGDGTTRPISVPQSQAAVAEAHLGTVDYKRGFHVEPGSAFDPATHYAGNSGTFNTDYWYPSLDTYNYLYARGYRHVRLAFRWERLQPTLNAALNATELSRLTTSVNNAGTAGLEVILDCHNYAGYHFTAGTETRMFTSGALQKSHMVDFWDRMSDAFKANANVLGYDLMNEPVLSPSFVGNRAAEQYWEQATQECVTAIRGNSDTKMIFVPGHYMDPINWWVNHPAKWITDPANNHRYQAHFYFWINGWQDGGNYSRSYASELADVQALGWHV